jgi:hypothetical protein
MADLPSGTVTFLFTDIEGSTALWERDRQAIDRRWRPVPWDQRESLTGLESPEHQ